ncbi:hypothetical protein D3C78_1364350 [compost metagenome]
MLILPGTKPSDTGAYHDAYALCIGVFANLQIRVLYSQLAGNCCELHEPVHTARFFFIQTVILRAKIFDFSGNMRRIFREIKRFNNRNTRFAFHQITPKLLQIRAERRNNPHAGNNNSLFHTIHLNRLQYR